MSTGFDYSQWGAQELRPEAKRELRKVPAQTGLVLEDVASGWVGAITSVTKAGGMHVMALEDRHGQSKSFQLGFGFRLEGEPVELTVPASRRVPRTPARTASGSVKVAGQRAKVAKASRIWVEGKHDAQLVEKIWGDDLRAEGIVVEPLGGIDDLYSDIDDFSPGPQRRLGVLADHLVPGTKESRIATLAMTVPGAAGNVLIVGHPYVDVWQVIKPSVLGIDAWPQIPRGVEWKKGIMAAFGWPHDTQADIAQAWSRLLGRVKSYADLEPSLLAKVEEVIDFVTVQ